MLDLEGVITAEVRERMLKCPKCQFEQPEDIYCAQCGVNMKTFVPQKPSLVLSFFRNQPLQLAILFVGIIAFVIYDQTKSPKTVSRKAVQTAARTHNPIPPQSLSISKNPSAPPPPVEDSVSESSQDVVAQRMKKVETLESAAAPGMKPVLDKPAGAAVSAIGVKTSLQISFYMASKSLIADLQKEAQAGNFSGEASGGVLLRKKLATLRNNGGLKPVSSNRYKLDGHAINIYKGQRSIEAGKSLGLYFQINTIKNDATSTQIEIKSWGNLKMQEPEESIFTSEVAINDQYVAFITGFLPRDKVFTDEEKAIFDGDRALKIYNQDDFWDGSTDLIMITELPETP